MLQKSKQQGAGLAFGSNVGESLFGAQVSNVLTRITVILAIVFLATTTALAYLGASRASTTVTAGIKPSRTMPASNTGPVAPMPMSSGPVAAPLPVPTDVPVPTMGDPSEAVTVEGVPAPAE